MDDVSRRVLELAWTSYQQGCVPIGAAVTDPAGMIVAEARNRLRDESAEPGQLSNSRIAHAEVNALAQLPARSPQGYTGYSLTSSVEPCCLCMGAVIMSGIGTLSYLWADAHAGAATCMTVARAPETASAVTRASQSGEPLDTLQARLAGL